ncbi:NAD(P)/FAD-dependent oxidoreductase [Lysobacter panacisoli]|uniref:FAD-dependent oxidoreductase n=1 Tax=Lysobacter panacisoli TaxID=1255263 RepID=A0ABP9LFQ7_9GAMM|nr:FAD-dependent oxidoreductase [Lysobacter panacisoli]
MDLKSGYPFWAIKNGLMHPFGPLKCDLRCEVAVIGGGITGAIVADALATAGYEVAVFEQRDIGWGSSAASTALLQYEIDTHLTELSRTHGEANAVSAYRACEAAIEDLGDLARDVRDVDYGRSDSLYFASRRWHVARLRREYEARRHAGLDTHWLEGDAIASTYGFHAPAGLLTHAAARLDPYRLANRLLQRLSKRGASVHVLTRLMPSRITPRQVRLTSEDGLTVTASHVVVATGYEAQRWIDQDLARNRSSYACISEPLELGALSKTMLWETARPYVYVRSTGDSRLLVGGEDDAIDIPKRRDARVEKKAGLLVKRIGSLFPQLALRPAFSWAGTFAETPDGLPYFGPHEQWGPRVLFAMAYGGNGIVYSMIGAELLKAHLERRQHPLKRLFGFERIR